MISPGRTPRVAACSGGDQLRPGGQERHPGLTAHADIRITTCCNDAQIHGPQTMVGGQHQLGRGDILSDRADIGPGGDRLIQGDLSGPLRGFCVELHLLHRDHRVRPGRKGIPGIHITGSPPGIGRVDEQHPRLSFGGAYRILSAEGEPIHRRSRIGRD